MAALAAAINFANINTTLQHNRQLSDIIDSYATFNDGGFATRFTAMTGGSKRDECFGGASIEGSKYNPQYLCNMDTRNLTNPDFLNLFNRGERFFELSLDNNDWYHCYILSSVISNINVQSSGMLNYKFTYLVWQLSDDAEVSAYAIGVGPMPTYGTFTANGSVYARKVNRCWISLQILPGEYSEQDKIPNKHGKLVANATQDYFTECEHIIGQRPGAQIIGLSYCKHKPLSYTQRCYANSMGFYNHAKSDFNGINVQDNGHGGITFVVDRASIDSMLASMDSYNVRITTPAKFLNYNKEVHWYALSSTPTGLPRSVFDHLKRDVNRNIINSYFIFYFDLIRIKTDQILTRAEFDGCFHANGRNTLRNLLNLFYQKYVDYLNSRLTSNPGINNYNYLYLSFGVNFYESLKNKVKFTLIPQFDAYRQAYITTPATVIIYGGNNKSKKKIKGGAQQLLSLAGLANRQFRQLPMLKTPSKFGRVSPGVINWNMGTPGGVEEIEGITPNAVKPLAAVPESREEAPEAESRVTDKDVLMLFSHFSK